MNGASQLFALRFTETVPQVFVSLVLAHEQSAGRCPPPRLSFSLIESLSHEFRVSQIKIRLMVDGGSNHCANHTESVLLPSRFPLSSFVPSHNKTSRATAA